MPIIESSREIEPHVLLPPTRVAIPKITHQLTDTYLELESTDVGANLIMHARGIGSMIRRAFFPNKNVTQIGLTSPTTIHAGAYRFDVIGPDVDSAMKQIFHPYEVKKDPGVYMRQATIALCIGDVNISHTSFLSMIDDIYATTAKHRLYHELRGESPCPISVIRELGTFIPLPPTPTP